MEVLLVILGIVGFIYLMITAMICFQVWSMSNPKLMPLEPKEKGSASQTRAPSRAEDWARNNDFEFAGEFTMKAGFQPAYIAAWQRANRPTFLTYYSVRTKHSIQTAFDFVTKFADDVGLTTCSKADGHSLPYQAGHYVQSFSNISLDDQWYRHVEMENYLMDAGGAQLVPSDVPFADFFVDFISKQMRFVRGLWFWPLRGAYWFFVRKRLWHNKSVKTQYEKGMIKMPNELTRNLV